LLTCRFNDRSASLCVLPSARFLAVNAYQFPQARPEELITMDAAELERLRAEVPALACRHPSRCPTR